MRYFRAPSPFVTFGWPKVIACLSLNPSSLQQHEDDDCGGPAETMSSDSVS